MSNKLSEARFRGSKAQRCIQTVLAWDPRATLIPLKLAESDTTGTIRPTLASQVLSGLERAGLASRVNTGEYVIEDRERIAQIKSWGEVVEMGNQRAKSATNEIKAASTMPPLAIVETLEHMAWIVSVKLPGLEAEVKQLENERAELVEALDEAEGSAREWEGHYNELRQKYQELEGAHRDLQEQQTEDRIHQAPTQLTTTPFLEAKAIIENWREEPSNGRSENDPRN